MDQLVVGVEDDEADLAVAEDAQLHGLFHESKASLLERNLDGKGLTWNKREVSIGFLSCALNSDQQQPAASPVAGNETRTKKDRPQATPAKKSPKAGLSMPALVVSSSSPRKRCSLPPFLHRGREGMPSPMGLL